jgi:hypothetical protein
MNRDYLCNIPVIYSVKVIEADIWVKTLMHMCAAPHREHPCNSIVIQSIKCRFRCPAPPLKESFIASKINVNYFEANLWVYMCAVLNREHPCNISNNQCLTSPVSVQTPLHGNLSYKLAGSS